MKRTYQKKSGGVSNERFVAGTQNTLGRVTRLRSISGGRHSRLKESEHTAQDSERLALLGTMAAVFAHEVANPLHGISTALEFVERELESTNFEVGFLLATLHGFFSGSDSGASWMLIVYLASTGLVLGLTARRIATVKRSTAAGAKV